MTSCSPYQLDFDNLVTNLPEPLRLSSFILPASQKSCFIGICGFEKRSTSAATELVKKGWKCEKTFLVRYTSNTMKPMNAAHFDRMHSILKSMLQTCEEPIIVEHNDLELKNDFGEALIRVLSENGFDPDDDRNEIVFDISVGSSRLLLEGLHALLNTSYRVTIAYTEATEYRPLFEEYRQYNAECRFKSVQPPEFLTIGVEKVEILKRIPGLCADSRPTYLVAVPSFSPMRIGSVLEELSPSRVHWLFGIPHLIKNRWRIDAQRDYHSSMIESLHRFCYVSTFDYREMLQVLENIYRKRKDQYDLLVCSLGSKLQKVGQILFHMLRPEVGALVSIPKEWNPDRYSDNDARAVYLVKFGPCKDLRKQIQATKTFRL